MSKDNLFHLANHITFYIHLFIYQALILCHEKRY